MTELGRRVFGYARAGEQGARTTARYYAGAGPDEKRIVRASFFTGIVGGVLWYVLILFWAALQFTSEEIGLMIAVGSIVGIVTYFIGGYLADRLGRKKMFLLGLTGEALGLLMFLTGKNFIVFTAAYGLTSFGGSLAWPSLTAWMGDKASSVNMKYLFGMQQFYNQLGLTIATFFGIFGPPFVADRTSITLSTGYLSVFALTAVCAFIPIIFIRRVSETKRAPERLVTSFDSRMRKILLMYCAQSALFGAGAALVIPWFPVIFEKGMGATGTEVAMIITVSNIILALGWLAVPKFADLRGSVTLITVCQIASVAPLVLIPFSEFSLLLVAGLYTARSLLMLVPSPVVSAYVVNIVSEDIRASFLAWSQVAFTLAFSGSSAIAGYLWANDYTRTAPFIYCGVMYVAGTLLFFAYFRGIKEPHEHKAVGSNQS